MRARDIQTGGELGHELINRPREWPTSALGLKWPSFAALHEVAEGPLMETQAVWSGCSTLAAMSGISLTL